MEWRILFYDDSVKKDTMEFPDKILAKMLWIFDIIKEHGPNIGKPYTTLSGTGFLR